MLYQLSYFRKNLRFLRVFRLRLGKENEFFFSPARTKTPLSATQMVGGGGLEPPNPEGADLQSAAIATMRTSQKWPYNVVKALSSR